MFLELFQRILGKCISKGMVSGKRQAVDSAYIKANASMDSLMAKEILSDAADFARELSANGNEPEASIATTGSEQTVSEQKLKEVESHHRWKERAYKDQPKGRQKPSEDSFDNEKTEDEHKRPRFLSNHTHYSPTDPDARISTKPGKPRQLTYSAQTAVDTANHVITGITAQHSDLRDSEALPALINRTIDNLKTENLSIEEVLADAGYSSGTALRYLKLQGIEGFIPNFGQYKPFREGFSYNKEKDQYQCQRGNQATLPFKGIATDSKGYTKRVYRSDNSKCKDCPLRSSCIGKSDFKKIEDSIDKPLYDQMHQRLQTRKAKLYKKLRSSTVEPVLGTLINFMGMRRVWTRGIEQANKFMMGAAAAYNLKKWMKYEPRLRKTDQMAVKPSENIEKTLQRLKKLISELCQPTYVLIS